MQDPKEKMLKSCGAAACSHNHSWKAADGRQAPISFDITLKDFILKEISLNGWIDSNSGRSAFLSEGLPAASSDKDLAPPWKSGFISEV